MSEAPKVTGTRYVLAVNNLSASVDYYTKQLGFTSWWEGDGWNFIRRGNIRIMLGECPNDRSAHKIKNHSYFAYIDVENIDKLFQEFASNKVEIIGELMDKPWGQREFAIRTIDGHRMMFGEEISDI